MQTSISSSKTFESKDPNTKSLWSFCLFALLLLIERNVMVHYLLTTEQTTRDIILKSPKADSSEGVPEKGIVIIGDDSSLHFIAPVVFTLWRWKTAIMMILTLCRTKLMCMFKVPVFNKKV